MRAPWEDDETPTTVLDEVVDVARAWNARIRLEWVRVDDDWALRATVSTPVVTLSAWADDLGLPDEPTVGDLLASMSGPTADEWEVVP